MKETDTQHNLDRGHALVRILSQEREKGNVSRGGYRISVRGVFCQLYKKRCICAYVHTRRFFLLFIQSHKEVYVCVWGGGGRYEYK